MLLIDRRHLPPLSRGPALRATLSAAERARLAAYRRPADQERFLLARAGLREILGHWLSQLPAVVPLAVGPHGKPHSPHPAAPAFNLSHSGEVILLAFHRTSPVGVDVERERPDLDWPPIARRVLPPVELEALLALPPAEQAKAFLSRWCRLEARLKASGMGLAGLAGWREGVAGDSEPAPGRRLWDVVVPEGYGAAVALGAGIKAHPAAAAGADRPSPPV